MLYGAVVGGPDSSDRFWDLRADWVQGEPALDYTAPLLTLAAHALASGAGDPYYTSVAAGKYDAVRPAGAPCDAAIQDGCGHRELPMAGKIALGVVVGVVGLVLAGTGAYWAYTARKHSTTLKA